MARQLGLTKTDRLAAFTYFFMPILVVPILFYLIWKSAARRIADRRNHEAPDQPPSDSI